MALPKQVQDAEDEAARIQQEIETPEVVPPEDPLNPAPDAPLAPAPEPTPELPPADTDATWEARYKTLQGMFKAEVPRLRAEVVDLKDRLTDAIRKLEQRAPEPQAPAPQEPAPKLGTAKDTEDFGNDLVDMVRRQAVDAARGEFQGEINRLEARNKDLETRLSGVASVQTVTAQSAYMRDLELQVPDYAAVNEDPLFLAWLNTEDVLSGMKRQEFFNRAYKGLDVNRTAKLMLAFKDSLKTEPVVVAPVTEPAPASPSATERLERQVQPVPSRTPVPVPKNETVKIWSMADIEGFYRSVTQGEFKGRETEQARIEADIDAAVAEGRLR